MLSRIAETLFWIGRYLARADGTSRILDVHLQLLLEDRWVNEDEACRSLLSVMGLIADPSEPATRQLVLDRLGADRHQPASIASSLLAARENARGTREVISTELWEALNSTQMHLPRKVAQQRAHTYFTWVRERVAMMYGIVSSSHSRDEGWQFFTLGTSLEQIDMVARLLATRSLTEASGPSWTSILRSCGAYEAYLHTYTSTPAATRAAEFLLTDRLFPRSILFAIMQAEQSLRDLGAETGRVGVSDNALRVLGQIRAMLEFTPIDEILVDLDGAMAEVRAGVAMASNEIRTKYFPVNPIQNWLGDSQ